MRKNCRNIGGFTLIELMVSMTIMAIVTGIGMAGYNSFNRKQQLNRGADLIATELRSLQKRADSGQFPTDGSTCNALEEYRATIATNVVRLSYHCDSGANTGIIGTVPLHSDVRVDNGIHSFYTAQGSGLNSYSGPGSITVTHSSLPVGVFRTIVISDSGSIHVEKI